MNNPGMETTPSPLLTGKKRLRVLCAEDDQHVARILKYALEQAGHYVECAHDGQQALERISADIRFFSLLITDHEMPRLPGLQLVEALRGAAFPGKIIVHSSRLREAEAIAYRSFAVDYILTKPVQLAELLQVIEQVGGDAHQRARNIST
jgi:two-component system response regulator CpxR